MKQQLLGLPIAFVAAASLMACVEPAETSSTQQEVSSHAPDPADEAFASGVADAMVDRIVALLFREFAVTTEDNAATGIEAISNVFYDGNRTMRLVGDVEPLQDNNYPQDDFERQALALAKAGQNFSRTERVRGRWWVRKSIAVSTDFSPSCVFCHPNFATLSNHWVGALMVRAEVH